MKFLELLTKNKTVCGIDIGTSMIRFALVNNHRGKRVLLAAGAKPIPENMVGSNGILETALLVDIFEDLLKKHKVKHKVISLTCNANKAIYKTIDLEASLNDDDIESMIRLDSDNIFSIPVEDIYFDFSVLGDFDESVDKRIEVQVIATRKDYIDEEIDAFETAGYRVAAVEPEQQLFIRSSSRSCLSEMCGDVDIPSNPGILYFDIGGRTIKSVVYNYKGNVELVKSEIISSGNVYKTLIGSDELTESEVFNQIIREDYPPEWQGKIDTAKESIISLIENFYAWFFERSRATKPNLILLGGGQSLLPDLTESVSKSLGIPCALIRPFDGFDENRLTESGVRAEDQACYAAAVAMAVRDTLYV